MAVTINHQTNDISATSGSLTIDGEAVGGGGGGGGVDLLSSADISNVAAVEFSLPSGYDYFTFAFGKVLPSTDGTWIMAQLSADGGSNYLSSYTTNYATFRGTISTGTFDDTVAYLVLLAVGNASGEEGLSGVTKLMFPAIAKDAILQSHIAFESNSGEFIQSLASNRVNSNVALNYIKFLAFSGNITSGTITLYGHKA